MSRSGSCGCRRQDTHASSAISSANLTTGDVVAKWTSVFESVDSSESRFQTVRLWVPNGTAASSLGWWIWPS